MLYNASLQPYTQQFVPPAPQPLNCYPFPYSPLVATGLFFYLWVCSMKSLLTSPSLLLPPAIKDSPVHSRHALYAHQLQHFLAFSKTCHSVTSSLCHLEQVNISFSLSFFFCKTEIPTTQGCFESYIEWCVKSN